MAWGTGRALAVPTTPVYVPCGDLRGLPCRPPPLDPCGMRAQDSPPVGAYPTPARLLLTAGCPEAARARPLDVGGAGGATTGGGWQRRRRLSQTGRWRGSGDDGPACDPVRATERTCPAAAPRFAGPTGGWVAAARGRGRGQPTGRHAAVATRCARNGQSPSSVLIASGDLICKD